MYAELKNVACLVQRFRSRITEAKFRQLNLHLTVSIGIMPNI